MRPPIDGGVVVVTGASSGIGAALARQVAPRAKCLVLVARRAERLEALAADLRAAHPSLTVVVLVRDLEDPAAVRALTGDVERAAGPVDVLVNNAGFGDHGPYDRVAWAKTERMIRLNVLSLAELTHAVLPGMVARGRGGVLNVSSAFGLAFLPGFAAYIGTKHFVTGFTEGLRLDLVGTGVVVSQVCPGPVATEFVEHARMGARRPPALVTLSAEACAKAALRGFERNRALIRPGVVIPALLVLGALTPRWVLRALYAPVARWMRGRPDPH